MIDYVWKITQVKMALMVRQLNWKITSEKISIDEDHKSELEKQKIDYEK